MATATKKSRAATQLARRAREVRPAAPMEFRVVEDNGGDYHWTIVADDGATLARSGDFASYDAAETAAEHVRDGAGSSRFARRALAAGPVDLGARRDARSDDADAERWLDEGGSHGREAVAPWPAPG